MSIHTQSRAIEWPDGHPMALIGDADYISKRPPT